MTNDSSKFHSMKKGEKGHEKSIHDMLNDCVGLKFIQANQFEDELKRFHVYSYPDNLHLFSDEFNGLVFKEIADRIEPLAGFIGRDNNEIWKFLTFMFACLKNTSVDKEYFQTVIEIFRLMGERLVMRDPQRSQKVFQDYFLETIE